MRSKILYFIEIKCQINFTNPDHLMWVSACEILISEFNTASTAWTTCSHIAYFPNQTHVLVYVSVCECGWFCISVC